MLIKCYRGRNHVPRFQGECNVLVLFSGLGLRPGAPEPRKPKRMYMGSLLLSTINMRKRMVGKWRERLDVLGMRQTRGGERSEGENVGLPLIFFAFF